MWQNNLNPSIFVCDQEMQKVWVRRLLYETDLGSMPASIIMTSFSQQMLYKISRLNIEMRKMKKPCQKIAVPFTRFLPLLETSTRKKKQVVCSAVQGKKRNSIHCPILSVPHKRSAIVPDNVPHNHERKKNM